MSYYPDDTYADEAEEVSKTDAELGDIEASLSGAFGGGFPVSLVVPRVNGNVGNPFNFAFIGGIPYIRVGGTTYAGNTSQNAQLASLLAAIMELWKRLRNIG